jgi:hypothetical protein
MSVDNEAKFIHLSFEEYIADSKKDFEEIKKLNTSLVKNDRSFENDIRMIKEALSGLFNQDVDIKRVMVGKPYIDEGEAKQQVTVVSIDLFWTVIWNCDEVCFDVTKKDIELRP